MKEKEIALYIPGEELENRMTEPTSQAGPSVRQWHSGKSSQRLQAEAKLLRGSLCRDFHGV